MKTIKQLFSSEILLFDAPVSTNYGRNTLKEFIYYLKFAGKRGMINFSFSGGEESFHPELSIKENYILDAVPTSLIKNKEDNFHMTADNLENEALKELIKATECVNRMVKNLSQEEKKLVAVAKALLSQSEHVFLDRPDLSVSPANLKTVKRALSHEAKENSRQILIQPGNKEKWLDTATHLVIKNENGHYIKSFNALRSASRQPKSEPPILPMAKKIA